MATKSISISEEAYERLKRLKSSKKDSFSDVIVKYYPKKLTLGELLSRIEPNPELADDIEEASREMRKSKMRGADFNDSA